MIPGRTYRHSRFYLDRTTGELKHKYFVVLARAEGGDLVARLLTSRAHGRPEHPPCFHGRPYAGYFLGVLGGPLTANSWVDLGPLEDFDALDFEQLEVKGVIEAVSDLPRHTLNALLDCAARADDMTRLQMKAILDELASGR